MKKFELKKDYLNMKKGTRFYLIAESEFIGVKEFVLRTHDFLHRITVTEAELMNNFIAD